MGTSSPQLVATSVRIPREILDAFRAVAEANHRNVSQELRLVMEQHIARHSPTSEASA